MQVLGVNLKDFPCENGFFYLRVGNAALRHPFLSMA